LTVLKGIFALLSIAVFLYYLRAANVKCRELGLIQVKVLALLMLLIIYNEPLSFISSVTHMKFYAAVQSALSATFFAFLLHFWAYLIDSIFLMDNSRNEVIRFYFPKLILMVLIWILTLLSVI